MNRQEYKQFHSYGTAGEHVALYPCALFRVPTPREIISCKTRITLRQFHAPRFHAIHRRVPQPRLRYPGRCITFPKSRLHRIVRDVGTRLKQPSGLYCKRGTTISRSWLFQVAPQGGIRSGISGDNVSRKKGEERHSENARSYGAQWYRHFASRIDFYRLAGDGKSNVHRTLTVSNIN